MKDKLKIPEGYVPHGRRSPGLVLKRSRKTQGASQFVNGKRRMNPLVDPDRYDMLFDLAEMHGAAFGEVIEALLDEYLGHETFLSANPTNEDLMPLDFDPFSEDTAA